MENNIVKIKEGNKTIMRHMLFMAAVVMLAGCGNRNLKNNDGVVADSTKITNIMDWSLNPDFERLDSRYMELIEANTGVNKSRWHYDLDSMMHIRVIVSRDPSDDKIESYDLEIYKKDSYMALQKRYYANGYIKYKGWRYCSDNFREGVWYFFDEEGNLTKTQDCNKGFNWEDVLKFCKKNNIRLPMGYRHANRVNITKNNEVLRKYWEITDYNHLGKTFVYKVNAKNGKLIKKEEFERIW